MKKIKIGVISLSKTLVDTSCTLAIEKGLDVQSAYASFDDGIEAAHEMISDGVELILAKGGTALIMKKYINVPVLSFPMSTFDILLNIREAAKCGKNILLISFFNRIKGIEFVNELFNIRLTELVCKNLKEMQNLLTTHFDKYNVLVAGSTACAFASKLNIRAIEIKISEEAIDATLENAISVANYNRAEQEKSHRFSLIIDGVSDGVIAYDHEGNITTINKQAYRLLKMDHKAKPAKSVEDLLPISTAINVISTKHPVMDKIEQFGKELFVFNYIPIVINNEAVGGVTTFKDATNVIEIEEEIRRSLSKGMVTKYNVSELIYKSEAMGEIVRRIKRFALTDSTIIIVGETGTGKELLAQSIHNLSRRVKQPFVSINCAALSEQLLESELFGYEEGAFTGSRKGGKPGLFEVAHGGTIFLDEISATSQNVQRHLLRVLQEREVMRIGAERIIPVNVRIIASANKNLAKEVTAGNLREDLFFRLNVLRVSIPPLRDRLEDLPLLAERFMTVLSAEHQKKAFTIPDRYIQKLMEYHWPGNIRQLRNFIERLLLICDMKFDITIFNELFFDLFEYQSKKILPDNQSKKEFLKYQFNSDISENAYETIKKALEMSNFNKTKAAKLLGISRTSLWKKLKHLNSFHKIA